MNIKDYLEQQPRNFPRLSLPNEFREEFRNYKRVDENDTKGRTWYKVYWEGTDCKYGAFMISPDTKEYRNTTFSEFYGGGVVD